MYEESRDEGQSAEEIHNVNSAAANAATVRTRNSHVGNDVADLDDNHTAHSEGRRQGIIHRSEARKADSH